MENVHGDAQRQYRVEYDRIDQELNGKVRELENSLNQAHSQLDALKPLKTRYDQAEQINQQ